MARCAQCDRRRVLVHDDLCKECLAEFFAGATCSRCDIDLGPDGLCPNDRCPFADTYQDESDGDWELPDDEERAHIERALKRRRGRK